MSKKRWQGLRSQRSGAQAEVMATAQLKLLGVEMVETIHNAWRVVNWISREQGIAQVVPVEKVSGDRIGILPGSGRRVLAEVKTGDDDRLQWSRLKPHQHEALALNEVLGGVSLLVWVTPYGAVNVMRYTDLLEAGWQARKSIDQPLADACAWEGVTLRAKRPAASREELQELPY